MNNYNNGFASLILVITISSMMLAIFFIQSIEYGHFFDQVQKKEYRLISHYSAYSCIDQAILSIAHDFHFETKNIIEFPDLNCAILSVLNNDNKKNIVTFGKFNKVFVYRSAVVRLFDDHLEVVSIE